MSVARWSRATQVTVASIAFVALAYAVLAWHRRWMSDDGMIVLRTVRNILEGNGPTFNVFERAEANTSTLWTYILVLFAGITRLRLEYLAVFLGLLFSVLAVVLGMDATRRLLRARGSTGMIVPAGALIVIGVFPFWDYATSGLETGLCFAWVALCWWMLVASPRLRLAAFVFGLGPLVRPDLGIGSIVFFATLWALHRPSWKKTLQLAAIGMALPVGYEIFRAGYYGSLVPLPALAKSATESAWARGIKYLGDFNHPYLVWIPLATVLALFAYALRKRIVVKRELVLIAAPIVTAALDAVYVLRVGGDFMHARMFLVPTFAVLLPAFVLPVRRFTVPAITVLAGWAVVTAIRVGDGEDHTTAGHPIEDERVGYANWTRRKHPIRGEVFVRADRPASTLAATALKTGERVIVSQLGWTVPMNPALATPIVYVAGRLGTGGVVVPLDTMVADTLGLAHPLGARITPTLPGYTGHEKVIPWAWIFADFGDPAHDDDKFENTPGYLIRSARHAMQCGELAELMDSVRAPMTPSRFWSNLTGAVRRTRLVIPNDPIEAEQKFCGSGSLPLVTASSVFPFDGWSKYGVVDGIKESKVGALGHTSKPKPGPGTEWLELRFAADRTVSKVVLYPATDGEGFPLDFTIQTWDGKRWIDQVTQKDYTPQKSGPHEFAFAPTTTDRIRVVGTKLRFVRGEYVFQLAEIEVP